MFELGGSIQDSITVKNDDGDEVDADSTPTATLTKPDGTSSSLTVAHDGTGLYSTDFTSAAGGDHLVKWTGLVSSKPFVFTTSAYVWDPAAFVVSLDDVKRHLNITGSTQDDELRDFILRAQKAVEKKVGPLTARTFTRRLGRYNKRADALVLPVTPVIDLVSVNSVIGLNIPASQLTVTPSGVVTGIYGWSFTGLYDVEWTAGWDSSIEEDLYLAVLEMIRLLYSASQRGGSSRPARSQDALANTLADAAYTYELSISRLLGPYMQQGFA